MIKTIFFDIGGVLIDIHPERTYQYISDSIDINISTIENRFPWGSHDKYERGTLSDEEWFCAYREALPQPCCLKSSDFIGRNLYPLEINDLQGLIEKNSPKLEIARRKIKQQICY